jgi:O-antigen/teichoic acid export membrane protein
MTAREENNVNFLTIPSGTDDDALTAVPPENLAGAESSRTALSDMFGRGLIYAAVFALQSAVMIVVTPLTVRSLSKSQFGQLVTVLTVVQFLIVILGFGLGTAIQRFHAQDDDSQRKTRGLLGIAIGLSLLSTAIVDLLGPLWANWLRVGPYNSELRFGVWAAGLAAIAMLIAQLFRSQDRLIPFCLVMFPLAIGSQVLGLIFVLTIERTATSYLAGMCAGSLLAVVLSLFLSRPLLLRYRDRAIVTSALMLSIPLVVNGVAYQTLNMGDRLVVQEKLGNFAVGRYQLAYNAAALVMLSLVLLSQAWLPRLFVIKDVDLQKRVLADSRDAIYKVLFPLVAGVSLAAPVALRILAPPSYHTNKLLLVVSLVAISAIPFSVYLADTRVLIVCGKTHSLVWATPIAAVANVLLNIMLVPLWGINASAFATVLAYGLLTAISGFSSRRVMRIPGSPPRVWIGLLAAVAISLLSTIIPTTPVFLAIRLAFAVACGAWAIAIVATLVTGADTRPRRVPAHRRRKSEI